jgi:hypothetical protein
MRHERDTTRSEGVYCQWETYPLGVSAFRTRLLTIERVCGDGSVQHVTCTPEEADIIYDAIAKERHPNRDEELHQAWNAALTANANYIREQGRVMKLAAELERMTRERDEVRTQAELWRAPAEAAD